MWRNFITTFRVSLAITPRHFANNSHLKWNGQLANVASKNETRSLTSTAALRNTEAAMDETKTALDGDAEYIVPYVMEYETRDSSKFLVKALRARFRLSPEDIKQILSDKEVAKSYKEKSLMATLEVLFAEGVSKKNFIEHPWIMTLNSKNVADKIEVLKSINGLVDLNDFVPFFGVQMRRLRKVVAIMNHESPQVNCGNRVYHIANSLNVPASLITKYLANRLFVLEMPLGMFNANLEHMINYNVEPLSLLKDLWAFRYRPSAVEMRLRRAQQAKKTKLMPWMVRCPEPILQKSLQLTLDEIEVLDNKSNVAEYIGERLGFSPEDAQAIMDKHPQVNSVRVTKIKEVLDYLLIEEKFSRHEIAQVPRILCHSLKTTKQRIEELKTINCRPSSLVIVCRSQREYEKFVNAWIENYNKFKPLEKTEGEESQR